MDNFRIPTAASIILLFAVATLVYAQESDVEWDILNQEAMDLYHQGKYSRAAVVAQKALEVAEENMGPDHPNVALSLNNLAELHRTQGDYAQAEPLYKRSLAIKEKSLGPNHPNVATSLKNLANVYKSMKRIEEAEELEQRAVQIRTMKR